VIIRSENAWSPLMGAWLAYLIYLMRSGDAHTAINNYVKQDWGEDMRGLFVASSNNYPAFYLAQQGGVVLCVIDGASSQFQAQQLLQGWRSPTDTPEFVRNPFVEQLRVLVMTKMVNDAFKPTELFVTSGWSLGGLVAQSIAREYVSPPPENLSSKNVTFGCPRSMTPADAARFNRSVFSIRWMNHTDAIPMLPPRFGEMPELLLAFDPNELRNFAKFTHPSWGYSVNQINQVEKSFLPTGATVSFAGAFAAYVWQYWNDRVGPHDISTYWRRLQNIAGSTQVIPSPLPDRVEPLVATPTQAIAQQAEITRGVVLNLEREQNAVQTVIPTERLCVAYKYNRLWYVRFGTETICCPGTRRRARNVARQLNDFLRNLQSVAVVDTDGLVGQLQTYLADAEVPNAGFSPAMNTGL